MAKIAFPQNALVFKEELREIAFLVASNLFGMSVCKLELLTSNKEEFE